jgi:hypothetical protein
MGKCPLFLLCQSPSKRNGGWACTKSHDERIKMCAIYVIAYQLGWIEISEEKFKEKIEVEKSGLV